MVVGKARLIAALSSGLWRVTLGILSRVWNRVYCCVQWGRYVNGEEKEGYEGGKEKRRDENRTERPEVKDNGKKRALLSPLH